MLLRPATPLTILLLIAFTLLLLSVISTPIVRGIPLASYKNVDYGVFGYCKGNECTNIHVRYRPSDISSTGDNFDLPSNARKSLSSILIVHPIAAFLTLICLGLAAAAHFHSPSHSPRYLLALLILFIPTLLVTLLAFLVDILLFVPHLAWGGWIVLAATIIHISCGVITCAMRRTLVSRKARKRRIAENAEMSGENFYNRQNAAARVPDPKQQTMTTETKEPFVSNSPSSDPTAPTFAAFRTNTRSSDDDRTPLNSRTPPNAIGAASSAPDLFPGRPQPGSSPYNAQLDEFGNPPPPRPGYGPRQGPGDPRLRGQYPDGAMGSRRGPPPPGFVPRGRGGYPPRGPYGRGGPYGAPRGPPQGGRGGPMGPMRGGPPGTMVRGRGPPPGHGPGFNGPGRNYDYNRGPGPRGPPPAGDGYDYGRPAPGPMRRPSPGMGVPEPEPPGQAIEMTPQQRGMGPAGPAAGSQPHELSAESSYHEPVSPASFYSQAETYEPPRANWAQNTSQPSGHDLEPAPLRRSPRYSGGDYYEDADPRFADNPGNARLPSALMPGSVPRPI